MDESPSREHPLPVRLFDAVQRLLSHLGHTTPGFAASEAALLDAARRHSGLEDFGDPSFLTGLRVLLRAYDEEAHLAPFGRVMVTGELTGILMARLAVTAALRRDPGILRHEIRRPIFILGLPRTGTTALHALLARDPANQALEYWLASSPGPRPPRETWEADPRFQAALYGLDLTYRLDPSLKAIHLMEADGPEECRHLFCQSFLDHTFDSNASIPGYTRWFEAQDMTPAYRWHRDVLRLVGSTSPARRWVLKYPAHMRNLRALLTVYPDACIVQTHRDPVKVLPSVASLVCGWRSLYEGDVDARAIGRWQVELYAGMLESCLRERPRHDPRQFFDLHFREVLADPLAAVRRIYAHFGFDWSDAAERSLRDWHAVHPQGKHGEHRYSAEQFGLVPAEVAERFARYSEHFGVESEASNA